MAPDVEVSDILDFVQRKKTEITTEHPYMLLIL